MFRDLQDAGKQLGQALERFRSEQPFIIGLARPGIVLAYEVATQLQAPLDVIYARHLKITGQPDALPFGAVAPNGVRIVDSDVRTLYGLDDEAVQTIAGLALADIDRRLHRYRSDLPAPDLRKKTAILVTDHMDTGMTAWAAARAIKRLNAAKLVLATAVSPPETVEMLKPEVDELVCLNTPEHFVTVKDYFRSYWETDDQDVIELLRRHTAPAQKTR